MFFKILLFTFAAFVANTVGASEKKVICYYGTWATYRPEPGTFSVDNVQADLCTHLIYAFAGIQENGTAIPLDEGLDVTSDNFNNFNALKENNTNLKTLLAVGGWNEGSAKYSTMVANSTLRQNFITSIIDLIHEYNFDGCDLDWEYPNQRDTTNGEADIDNFSTLLKEMRTEFDKEGLLMSAAVGATEAIAEQSYDVATISQYLDWVGVMTYDLYGTYFLTGYNAAIYQGETAANYSLVSDAVNYWLSAGCPPEKLVLGLALYGRTFTLADAANNGVGATSTGAGPAGPYTREAGTLGYNEICGYIKNETWPVVYDDTAKVPYTYNDTTWVSFDNAESLTEKVKYAIAQNLTGVMVWSIETDDFQGYCGEVNPLLKAINKAFDDA